MLKINTYRLLLSLEELWVIFSTSLSHVSILLAQNLMHLIQHFLKLKRNLCTSYKYYFSLSFNLKNITKYNTKLICLQITTRTNFIPEIIENYVDNVQVVKISCFVSIQKFCNSIKICKINNSSFSISLTQRYILDHTFCQC